MNAIFRGLATYAFLWLVFRIAGKRSLSEATTFDVVLLLIMSEAVQNSLMGQDHSMTGAALLIITLLGTDLLISILTTRSRTFDRFINGLPIIVVENGKAFSDRMQKARLQTSDILEAARGAHGVERLDQIKYAVLERDGTISIVPSSS